MTGLHRRALASHVDSVPAPDAAFPYHRRARAAGGPEDHALYTCDCGYVFEADVCASVDCPVCGSDQSW